MCPDGGTSPLSEFTLGALNRRPVSEQHWVNYVHESLCPFGYEEKGWEVQHA